MRTVSLSIEDEDALAIEAFIGSIAVPVGGTRATIEEACVAMIKRAAQPHVQTMRAARAAVNAEKLHAASDADLAKVGLTREDVERAHPKKR